MKVRCIDNGGNNFITEGKIYKVLEKNSLSGYAIIHDLGDLGWYKKERFEIIKECDDMKELTFKEVIASIKEGEVWESHCKRIIGMDFGDVKIENINKEKFGHYVTINQTNKYKLQREICSFSEAFKAYEEGKEVESCISTNIYFKSENKSDCCIRMNPKSFYYEEIIDFEQFDLEEIRGKWYINS